MRTNNYNEPRSWESQVEMAMLNAEQKFAYYEPGIQNWNFLKAAILNRVLDKAILNQKLLLGTSKNGNLYTSNFQSTIRMEVYRSNFALISGRPSVHIASQVEGFSLSVKLWGSLNEGLQIECQDSHQGLSGESINKVQAFSLPLQIVSFNKWPSGDHQAFLDEIQKKIQKESTKTFGPKVLDSKRSSPSMVQMKKNKQIENRSSDRPLVRRLLANDCCCRLLTITGDCLLLMGAY